jgi:hypothetical protein
MVRLWSEICEQLSHRRVNWDAEPISHGGRQASKVNVGRDFVLLLADTWLISISAQIKRQVEIAGPNVTVTKHSEPPTKLSWVA